MKSNTLARVLTALGVGLLGLAATAQAQDSGGPTPGNPPATQVPIDGGATLLLAGGVALGLKKLRDRRNTPR